jgi:energy-converting hydrogenase Eha subunit C
MGPSQQRSKRDQRRLLLAALVYVPSLLAAEAYADRVDAGLVLFVPALLAGLAMILFAIGSVRHGDELQRLIHVEALAFAFVALAVSCFALAVLAEPAGAALPSVIGWNHLWIALSSLWCGGLVVAHWRHR